MDRSDSRVVRLAVIASAIVALVMAASATSYGQPGPSFGGPSCTAPPAPQADQWPRAGTVDLGATVSATPVTFTGALLLGDSHGNGLRLVSVGRTSLNGGVMLRQSWICNQVAAVPFPQPLLMLLYRPLKR